MSVNEIFNRCLKSSLQHSFIKCVFFHLFNLIIIIIFISACAIVDNYCYNYHAKLLLIFYFILLTPLQKHLHVVLWELANTSCDAWVKCANSIIWFKYQWISFDIFILRATNVPEDKCATSSSAFYLLVCIYIDNLRH